MTTQCPKCKSENIYQEGNLWICPECSNEWMQGKTAVAEAAPVDTSIVKDASGNILADGDHVVIIKDLKIKGSSNSVKGGTKIRNIRLYDAGDGHNISCRVEDMGVINLKSEFVRKV